MNDEFTLEGLGQVVKKLPDVEVISWDTAVATTANSTQDKHVKKGMPFIVQAVTFMAYTTAATSNLPAGTPLARAPIGFDSALAPLSLVTLEYTFNGVSFANGAAMSALLCTGTAERPYYPPVSYVLGAKQSYSIKLTNGTAVSIKAELQFHGYYAVIRR